MPQSVLFVKDWLRFFANSFICYQQKTLPEDDSREAFLL